MRNLCDSRKVTRRDFFSGFIHFRSHYILHFLNANLFLTEREGRTWEYWPEVVAVRTERSEVRSKMTEGQYSPVRLELARLGLVSSSLYGTRAMLVSFLVKHTCDHLHLKSFHRNSDAGRRSILSFSYRQLP